ncbi:MAG: FtsQ-type POTRA domain-containing protein [Bryobacterales bacterium]|nr:FtsQ-type POTRA domain-containing protein [Bryobacteraceae bacterium]MDW8131158.1 FtsQ-type POTRA domain-containing protein [Bryobacterales bacterium]
MDWPETGSAEPQSRQGRSRTRPPSRWRSPARTLLGLAPWLLAGAAGAWSWGHLKRFLEADPRFRLPATEWEAGPQAVDVRGAHAIPRQEVLEVFRPDLGGSIFRVPLAERRRQLLAMDWVADATVARRWPNRLEIRIRERRPVAFVVAEATASAGEGGAMLIDAEGVLLRWPAQGEFSLPVLWGVRASQPAQERRGRVRLMLEVLGQAGPLASRISEVDVGDPRNVAVTLVLEDRAVRLWLGRENFAARLNAFREYYGQIARWAPEARTFDLRVDGQVRVADAALAQAVETGRNGKGEQRAR